MNELHKEGGEDLIKHHKKAAFAVDFFGGVWFLRIKGSKKFGKKTAEIDINCSKNI